MTSFSCSMVTNGSEEHTASIFGILTVATRTSETMEIITTMTSQPKRYSSSENLEF
jgi:hypothetical protein